MIPKLISDQFEELKKYGIDTPLRLAHFLAQCSHESGGFKTLTENLNYSADGLKKIFSKYFPGSRSLEYARQPEKIANLVYANRRGNVNEKSGDGWKYRGRGCIQLTGKENYKKFSEACGEDCVSNPDLVSGKYFLQSAAWFWQMRGLNTMADLGASNSTVLIITRKINGGENGLADRIEKFNEYYSNLK